MVYVYLFVALVLNAVANILMKLGAVANGGGLFRALVDIRLVLGNWQLMAGIVAFVLALAFYTLALSKMSLSVAYPIMTSLGFLIVVGFSVLSLHESVSWWQYAGMGMIVLGVLLVAQVGK